MNKDGFTLVELLIVLGVAAVLSVIGFFGFKGSSGRDNLHSAQLEIVSRLRSLQNDAYSGRTWSAGATPMPTTTHWAIFSALVGRNNRYRFDGEERILPGSVKIQSLSPTPLSGDSLAIYFYHPAKTESFNCSGSFVCEYTWATNVVGGDLSGPVVITFRDDETGLSKTIRIEGSSTKVLRIFE